MTAPKKRRTRSVFLALLVVGALCVVFALPFLSRGERGSQADFGEKVLQILDAGIYADTEEWKADREHYGALVERATTRQEAAKILHQAALSAGGRILEFSPSPRESSTHPTLPRCLPPSLRVGS